MVDDGELLRQYAENRSEAAFTELVRRHLNLVYSAALRQVGGDIHRAKDVSQSVFADLARKAPVLSQRTTLAGWLYISTHRAAAHVRRTEQRRQIREQKAQVMQEISTHSDPQLDWDQVRPMLDDVLQQLSDRDREAVLLRVFEGCAFADIGTKLRLSEDAARMRVDRALEKLRACLARHGVASTTAALAMVLANQAVIAAPEGLLTAISSSAITGVSGAGAALGLIQLMNLTKLQIAVATAVLVTGAATGLRTIRANQNLNAQIASIRQENQTLPQLQSDHARLQQLQSDLTASTKTAEFNAKYAAASRTVAHKSPQAPKPIDSLAAALAVGPIFGYGAVDQEPVPIDQDTIRYPPELKELGIEGRVVVSFVVAADGGVVDAHATNSTNADLAKAAVRGVSQWVFKPGQKGGQPVNTGGISVPIVFNRDNSK